MSSSSAAETLARRLLLTFGVIAASLVAITWFVFRPESLRSPQLTEVPGPTVSSEPSGFEVPRSPSPNPAPDQWQLPSRHWEPLVLSEDTESALMPLGESLINEFPAVVLQGCPQSALAASLEEYKQVVTQQWECLHTSFIPIFDAIGASTVAPELVFYTGVGSRSECGWIEAPAFYCSAGDGTGYFGSEHYEMARNWDLAVNEMVNHEYGHHVQKMVGITAAKLQVSEGPDVERRAELQAICWSGMLTFHNEAIQFDQSDFEGWVGRVDAMVSSEVHGTRESLEHWGLRGLWATGFSDCNTWLAHEDLVA